MKVIPFWPSQPLRYQIRDYFVMEHVKHGSNTILTQSTLKESNPALLWWSMSCKHGSNAILTQSTPKKKSNSALLWSSTAGMEVISNTILTHSTLKSSNSALLWSSIFGMKVIPFWPSQPLRYQIRHYFDEACFNTMFSQSTQKKSNSELLWSATEVIPFWPRQHQEISKLALYRTPTISSRFPG